MGCHEMDLIRKKPVEHSVGATPVSWETAIVEAEHELKRARLLVETLEALIVHYRKQMRAGIPFDK